MPGRLPCPARLRAALDALEPTVSGWSVPVTMEHMRQWVNQFDPADYDLAVRVAQNLTVVGNSHLREALSAAFRKLSRSAAKAGAAITNTNTVYAGVGDSAKSGALIAYHFRVLHDLPQSNFREVDDPVDFDVDAIKNFVLLDDMIGTGKTAADDVERLAVEVYPSRSGANIYVLAACGYRDGMKNVTDRTGAAVFAGFEFGEEDTARSPDSQLYHGLSHPEREDLTRRLKEHCRRISTSELGYGNVGGLLAFEFNTPNTTLPIVWADGHRWYPLFPRATKVPGVRRYVEKMSRQREVQVSESPNPPQRKDIELTLFVEGKFDEYFFDFLARERALASSLGVRSVSAVALGGLYQSDRLLELLRQTRKFAVFVLDGDPQSRALVNRNAAFSRTPTVYFEPYFIATLDLERLLADDSIPTFIKELYLQPHSMSDRNYSDLERALFKNGPFSSAQERMEDILRRFLDTSKVEALTKQIGEAINLLLSSQGATTTSPPEAKGKP